MDAIGRDPAHESKKDQPPEMPVVQANAEEEEARTEPVALHTRP